MANLQRCKPLLGTFVSISINSVSMNEATLIDLCDDAFAEIERIQNTMSFHDINSELSHINREAFKKPYPLSTDMHHIITTALSLSAATEGYYDITITPELIHRRILPAHKNFSSDPSANWQDVFIHQEEIRFHKKLLLDLGGIAKGYAVDKAFDAISHEVDNLCINAGGDCRIKQWRKTTTAIKASDRKGKKHLIHTPMKNSAIATSSNYYTKDCIINPKTKAAFQPHHSATVFANECIMADALTKIALLKPSSLSQFINHGVSAYTANHKGQMVNLPS